MGVCKRMPVKQNMLRLLEMNPVLQCFAFFLLATTADSRGVAYMGHGTGNNEPKYVKEGETTLPATIIPGWVGPLCIGLVLVVLLLIILRCVWVRMHREDREQSDERRGSK